MPKAQRLLSWLRQSTSSTSLLQGPTIYVPVPWRDDSVSTYFLRWSRFLITPTTNPYIKFIYISSIQTPVYTDRSTYVCRPYALRWGLEIKCVTMFAVALINISLTKQNYQMNISLLVKLSKQMYIHLINYLFSTAHICRSRCTTWNTSSRSCCLAKSDARAVYQPCRNAPLQAAITRQPAKLTLDNQLPISTECQLAW